MNSIEKLADIQCLINEAYSDKEPLTEEQKASKKVFNEYCEDIRKILGMVDDDCKIESVADYRDTEEYLHKCRYTIEHLLSWLNDKIEIDRNDKMIMTNQNAYIEKCGALNALLDALDLVEKDLYGKH